MSLRLDLVAAAIVLPVLVSTVHAADHLLTHGPDFARVSPAEWRAEGWRVENPDEAAQIVEVDGVLAFVVTQPHTAMAWTLTSEPFWTTPFSTLAASYFVEGGVPEGAPPAFELFDGSTGPITPGATNAENPLASGGRFSCGTLTPGLHVEAVDLSGVENLDRVAEITITVRSGDAPLALRLNQLAFMARPSAPAEVALPEWQPFAGNSPTYVPLPLPAAHEVSRAAMAKQLGLSQGWWPTGGGQVAGMPFEGARFGVATPLHRAGGIKLEAKGRGDTLALLCAARLWGSDLAWYSKNYVPVRRFAPKANQFVVAIEYGDGAAVEVVPKRTDREKPGLWPGVGVYTVPVEPGRELRSVRIEEAMSYGQVILLGASLVRDGAAPPDPAGGEPSEPSIAAETRAEVEGPYVLESDAIRLVLDAGGQVLSMQLGEERREIVTEPFSLFTLSGEDGSSLPVRPAEALVVPENNRLVLLWELDGGRQCELALTINDTGGLDCAATLSNRGNQPWALASHLPRFKDVRISKTGHPAYLLGGRSAIRDTAPIDMAEIYGGRYPNQFMDLYDENVGGGLAFMVRDKSLERKWFEFKLGEDGRADMGVSYRRLQVAPGDRMALPPVTLMPHEDDWREPFSQYRDWVRSAFPRRRQTALDEVFYCRRDYPLGGTSYLFDVEHNKYSFETLISESEWAFGGVDMVDISGWAYNEAVGRVGTYLENDLGGLGTLAKGVWTADKKNVVVGLYFEGYLLDRRARNAAAGLAEWQLVRAGNKPAWWPGEMEFFCCPGAAGWQDALASDIAAVAARTKAAAVYVDQLGICDVSKECWAPNHAHPVPSNPIETEIALLRRIRAELDRVRPECAIYIEHIPCDAMTPYIDGAFNLGMKHKKHALGPTKLPLHRYLHPEVPVFEMVAHGIRPIPAEADDLKLAFFHGMGLWLKGRGASWYSAGFRQQARNFYPIYSEFGGFFRSGDAEPHVDTLQEGVYANRFSRDGDTLYTIYNANPALVGGALLSLGNGEYRSATSLVDGVDLALEQAEEDPVVAGMIPPHGVGAILLLRGEEE